MKFDAIIGNPPYNPKKSDNKDGHITHNLWSKFVENSLNNLSEGGYLIYVHPPLWRKPDSDIYKRMISDGHFDYVRIFTQSESKQRLNFPVKVDYYSFKKRSDDSLTVIFNGKETIECNLSTVPFLPNGNLHTFSKIISSSEETEVYYNCEYHHFTQEKTGRVKNHPTDTHRHKVLYLYNSSGPVYYYTDTKVGKHFGVPKIIVPMGKFFPILDLSGEIGTCEVAFSIIGDEEYLRKVYEAMNTKQFISMMEHCKWKVMQIDYRMFKYLKKDFWKEFI